MAKDDDEKELPEQAAGEPPEKTPITIDVSDDADDGDEAPADKQGRKTHRESYRKVREELKAERAEREKMARELAELRGRATAPAPVIIPQAPREPAADPDSEKLEAIGDQQDGLLAILSTPGLAADRAAKLTKQWRDLDRQRVALIASTAARANQPRQPDANIQQRMTEMAILRSNHADVFSNPMLQAECEFEDRKIAYAKGIAPNFATADEAARAVKARHGIGASKPQPTDTDRARHSATASRPGTSSAQTYTPTKQDIKLAMAFTEHLSKTHNDQQRIKYWYDKAKRQAR